MKVGAVVIDMRITKVEDTDRAINANLDLDELCCFLIFTLFAELFNSKFNQIVNVKVIIRQSHHGELRASTFFSRLWVTEPGSVSV
jgi:hypothetical protein